MLKYRFRHIRFHTGHDFPLETLLPAITSRPFMYFLSAELLIVGAWIEAELSDDFFARTGAILVMLTLLQLFLCFKYAAQEKLQSQMNEYVRKEVGNIRDYSKNEVIARLSVTRPGMPEAAREDLAGFYSRVLNEGDRAEVYLQATSYRLGRVQFEVALLGTFIWGFGDLLI